MPYQISKLLRQIFDDKYVKLEVSEEKSVEKQKDFFLDHKGYTYK